MNTTIAGTGSSGTCVLHSLAQETAPGSPPSVDDPADPQVFPGALHIAVGDGATKHQMAQEAIVSRHQAETTSPGASSQGVDASFRPDPASVDVDFSLHGESPLECDGKGIAREEAGAEVAIQENYIQSCLFSGLMNAVDLARNAVHGLGEGFAGVVAKVSSKAAEYATSLVLEEVAPSLGKDTWDELAIVIVSVTESIAASSYRAVQKWIDILNNIAVRKAIEESFPEMTEAVANDISEVSIAMLSDSSPRRIKTIEQGLQVALKSLLVCSLEKAELDMTRFWKRAISGAYISVAFSAEPDLNKLAIKFMSIGAKALTAQALRMAVPGLGKYAAADLGVVLFPVMEPVVVKLSNALVDRSFDLLLNTAALEFGFEENAAHGEYA